MGIYEAELNGQKLGEQYFAPGFTSYKSYLQYQTYDVTALLTGDDTLTFTVAGGWAVGSFVFTRKNRVTADRQALLAELRIEYTDGTTETIGTDATWQVSESGPVRMADLYDGETYDATQEISDWHNAAPETLKVTPSITADYGAPVKAHEVRKPVAVMTAPDGETIYDFGQNLAGVVRIKFNGKAGQVVTVRHAEILNPDGSLNTTFLRTAKPRRPTPAATANRPTARGSAIWASAMRGSRVSTRRIWKSRPWRSTPMWSTAVPSVAPMRC